MVDHNSLKVAVAGSSPASRTTSSWWIWYTQQSKKLPPQGMRVRLSRWTQDPFPGGETSQWFESTIGSRFEVDEYRNNMSRLQIVYGALVIVVNTCP